MHNEPSNFKYLDRDKGLIGLLAFSFFLHLIILSVALPKRPIVLTSFNQESVNVRIKQRAQTPVEKLEEKKVKDPIKQVSIPLEKVLDVKEEHSKEDSPLESVAQVLEFEETIQSAPPPHYPLLARRRGQEGTVVLEIKVKKEGDPLEVSIVRSSGYDLLDHAAQSAVMRWRFRPLQHLNDFYFVQKSIEFRLN